MELITSIAAAIPDWLEAIFALMVAASAVAALTPTKKDDAVVAKILNGIKMIANIFALNIGNAKPKDSDKK